jgi:tRNA-binding protein
MQRKPNISFEEFSRVDLRVGTVKRAEEFPEARKPAIKLWIWFGDDIGELKTSAQITDRYMPQQLIGRQVIAVVNFPPKQIGPFMSECLVTGVIDDQAVVTLLQPDHGVDDGLSVA